MRWRKIINRAGPTGKWLGLGISFKGPRRELGIHVARNSRRSAEGIAKTLVFILVKNASAEGGPRLLPGAGGRPIA